jgi:hypothetical protein
MAKHAAAMNRIPVTPSSGNVFADLGVPQPEEELAKADLAIHLRDAIKRRRLTQGTDPLGKFVPGGCHNSIPLL